VSIAAQQIEKLLAQKHAEDVFVPECKNGPSNGGELLRLDAWAMKKSWSKPLTVGYEIKVSRSDFMKDEKWKFYLQYCNELYFVCPAKLILPEDLPPEIGLMYVSATGNRLFTKRKAAYRDVQIPENLFRYILMCRTKVTRERTYSYEFDKIAYWRQWLEESRNKKDLGILVSRRVAEICRELTREMELAKRETQGYQEIKDRIIELGFDPGRSVSTWAVQNRLAELIGEVPFNFKSSLKQIQSAASALLEKIEASEKQ
jgi:hypothetical protein